MLTISSAVRVENYCNLENEHSNITTPQHRYASAQAGTSSCTVNCAPGYSGSGGTVTCDASTQDQDASFDNVQCTENECTLPDLDAVNLVLSSSCSTPLTTRTNSECTTECASRYYSTSASSTLTLIICFSSNWFNKILYSFEQQVQGRCCVHRMHRMEPLRVLFQLRTVQRSRVFRSLYPPVRRREMSLSSHVHCIKHALSVRAQVRSETPHKEMHARTMWNFESCPDHPVISSVMLDTNPQVPF